MEESATAAGPAETAEVLLANLKAISQRSAARLQNQAAMTEADLYNEDGMPA